jgi:hypothetical protein
LLLKPADELEKEEIDFVRELTGKQPEILCPFGNRQLTA